jgi:hypothetical protein
LQYHAHGSSIAHSWWRKRRVDNQLVGLKTHRRAHLVLALLKRRKPLTHLLVWLTDESIVGATHGDQGLVALDENVLLLASTGSSTTRLMSSLKVHAYSQQVEKVHGQEK